MRTHSRTNQLALDKSNYIETKKIIRKSFSEENAPKVKAYAKKIFHKNRNISRNELCKKVILHYKGNKKLQKETIQFDEKIGKLKLSEVPADTSVYLLEENRAKFKKWTSYGFDSKLYTQNPKFVDFMFEASLGSQMKVTRNCEIKEIDGEAALLVEGYWIKASHFLERFEVKVDKTQHEKFIFEKKTQRVFSYTDTGQGLVPFHPYQEGLKTPVSNLDKESYESVLKTAQTFVRKGEEGLSTEEVEEKKKERTYVLQIVSSRVGEETKHGFLTKNIFNLVNRKHPWIRLVEPNTSGDQANVYSVGFGWDGQPSQPLKTVSGRFRSIDAWEYKPAERVVTNISVSKKEFEKLQEFPQKFINDQAAGFHLMSQNCSVGLRVGVEEATGIKIPTEIGFGSLLFRFTPDFFQKIVNFLDRGRLAVRSLVGRVCPNFVEKGYEHLKARIVYIYQATVAFRLALVGSFLGAGKKEGNGVAVDPRSRKKSLDPLLYDSRYWHDLSLHSFNMPGLLQEWQEKQASTVRYDRKHVQFAIVPPESQLTDLGG